MLVYQRVGSMVFVGDEAPRHQAIFIHVVLMMTQNHCAFSWMFCQ